MSSRKSVRERWRRPLIGVGAVMALLIGPVLVATPAAAAIANVHVGYAYQGKTDSWIGSYRLGSGTGTIVYCVDAGKGTPVSGNFGSVDWTPSGFTVTQKAKLAYLMRTWGTSTNKTTAAAVSLNVWRVAGMGGHTDSYYTSRAEGNSAAVLAAANSQRTTMNLNATTDARASVQVVLASGGATATVKAIVERKRLTGWSTVATGTHTGTVTLTGGVFESNGLATRTVSNGTVYNVIPTPGPVVSVGASTSFPDLPYGSTIGVYTPDQSARQKLIIARNTTIDAAGVQTDAPAVAADIDMQLEVATQTSADVAVAGASITDTLRVAVVATTENPDANWSVAGEDPDFFPIPVTIRSRLWGPFAEAPALSPTVPGGASLVCEVTMVVTDEGEYTTDPCVLPAGRGYYVWTATIDPNDTSIGFGRDNLLPFQSAFGEAAETTLIPWEPEATTAVTEAVGVPGACIADQLTLVGAQPGQELVLDTSLWGPFVERPLVGTEIDPLAAPLAFEGSVTAVGDGVYTTECFTLTEPGYYVFTHQSAGSAAALAFSSLEVFEAETTLIQWVPAVSTEATQSAAAPEDCVADVLTVTGLKAGALVSITSHLWGPFEKAPAVGSDVDAAAAPLLGSTTLVATGDGEYTTECQTVTEAGHYVFTYESAGSAEIAEFASLEVFESEMFALVLPPWEPPEDGLANTGGGTNYPVGWAFGRGLIGFGLLIMSIVGFRRVLRKRWETAEVKPVGVSEIPTPRVGLDGGLGVVS